MHLEPFLKKKTKKKRATAAAGKRVAMSKKRAKREAPNSAQSLPTFQAGSHPLTRGADSKHRCESYSEYFSCCSVVVDTLEFEVSQVNR